MSTRLSFPQYLRFIQDESAAFAAAIADADPQAAVPSCPEWTAADLAWHLAEVQWFWAQIINGRPQAPGGALGARPTRPDDSAALLDLGRSASSALVAALDGAAPDEPAWSWFDADQSVGFSYRRQAHEALIHRLDAELTAGRRSALDPALSNDGVDEALRVMYGGGPPWADLTVRDPDARVRVTATDSSSSWLVRPASYVGDHEGRHFDEPTLDVLAEDDGMPVVATITGSAADLDCWLWGRSPVGEVARAGNLHLLAEIDGIVSAGIQ